MSVTAKQPFYTPEEYLLLERQATCKSELINGSIVAMTGVSRAHNLIAGNIFSEIHTQLKGRVCEVYRNDMRVAVNPTGLYTYPDVVVACGEIQFDDEYSDTLLTPSLIVEVLSPSTEAYDRGDKFAHYRRLQSLQEYVLVSQTQALIECYTRQGEQWLLTEVTALEDTMELASISCILSLAEVYDKVPLA